MLGVHGIFFNLSRVNRQGFPQVLAPGLVLLIRRGVMNVDAEPMGGRDHRDGRQRMLRPLV